MGLYDPESAEGHPDARIAYVGPGGFDQYLDQTPNLGVDHVELNAAVAGFHSGQYGAVIEETYANASAERVVTMLLPESEVQTTLLVTQFKSLLRDYERDLRQEREDRIQENVIYVETEAHPNVYYGFVFSTLLPLLVLTPVFLAGAVTGDSVSQEIQTQTLGLLRSSPISTTELILGKLLTPILLVPLQVALWILLLRLNGLVVANVLPLLAFSTVLALLLCAGSILVAMHVRREGQTQAAYALLVLVLLAVSLLLPREPLNLIARVGAGSSGPTELLAMVSYAAVGFLLLALAIMLGRRRLAADER